MAEKSAIFCEGLGKSFASLDAVKDLDLDVPAGVVAGFLGPNGAGKTTTLRMLTGLVRPSRGRFRLGTGARGLGALVEDPSFPGHMSGRACLVHLARMKGVEQPEADVTRLLEELALAPEAWDRSVSTYSTGMRGRLGIAFALLGDPELVILDEPTRGLDPEGRRRVLDLLRKVAAERGTTLFVSSHLLWEVEALADWVAVLHEGRGLFQGTVEALRVAQGEGGVILRVEDPAPARSCCDEHGWAWRDDGAALRVDLPAERVPDLVAAVVAAGGRITSVEARRETLEDLYLRLTKEAS